MQRYVIFVTILKSVHLHSTYAYINDYIMKKMMPYLTSGILGGLIVLLGLYFMPSRSNNFAEAKAISANFGQSVMKNGAVPFDFVEASKKTTNSVVHIKASQEDGSNPQKQSSSSPFDFFFGDDFGSPFDFGPKEGTGSGVIISEDGYIVTNNHVVEFAKYLEVTLFDDRVFLGEVVGTYPKADLAVIKIDSEKLPVLKWADSDVAEVGEWVLAVGNPLELNSTVTAGIISAKGRNIDVLKSQGRDAIESFIQTDAVVNPGNSGGALVNKDGQLLGINTAIKTQTGYYAGYSFAIPSNIVKTITNDIIEYGSYQRAYLGVSIMDLDSELAEQVGYSDLNGVYIDQVSDGGSAQYAGILPQDIIIKIDDNNINSVPEIQESISKLKVGDIIKITIFRNGDFIDVPVRLRAS